MDTIDTVIKQQVDLALAEDIGPGDITTLACIDDTEMTAVIVARSDGTLAGWPVAELVFRRLDPKLKIVGSKNDGDRFTAGDKIAEFSGKSRAILSAERTALNFLGHLSGVATMTAKFVDKVKDSGAVILDTRKTIPGMRYLEKYAVTCGGGQNHRYGLYDMVLIKDNHIEAAGSITKAVDNIRSFVTDESFKKNFPGDYSGMITEVEIETEEQLKEAISAGVKRLMLDNRSIDQLAAMVKTARNLADDLKLEASGNVSLDNVAAIAGTGVDYISIGALTHSSPASDFSLEVG
jgi:nicotinate-nucleotide pyrophosphorylase (carboxylating)